MDDTSFEDWCKWNEGKLDDSEWEQADTTFLFAGRNDDEIEKIYSYFPQGPELIKRYFRARRDRTSISDQALLILVRKDLTNMGKIARLAGNRTLAQFLEDPLPINFVLKETGPTKTEERDKVLYDFLETINDYVIFNSINQSPSASDIDAGLYHAHDNNFQVTHALVGPLIKNGHYFEHYLELYAKRVHYEIFENGVKIYR